MDQLVVTTHDVYYRCVWHTVCRAHAACLSCSVNVFMLFDNPASCRLAQLVSGIMLFAIMSAVFSFAVESLPAFRLSVRHLDRW